MNNPYALPVPSRNPNWATMFPLFRMGTYRSLLSFKEETDEPMEIGMMKRQVLWSGTKKTKYTITVGLDGKERKALIDSGCSQSVVKQDLVKPELWNPHTQVLITCVDGDQRLYPVATVSLNWRGAEERISVGVIPALGEDMIIGTDYEDFVPLLTKASQEYLTNT
ncbi:hypothetical protein NDU88_008054 [Pleurodeles waltl]|uniref:Peptidase A2 domain-containing protein n=1 Tax=Pleurodeles waltl TaxID=8319 RepID=A0AAV7QMG2_PLEWA|nr:hypothetical protein NDU88_008054 [Pleurodeles waltl]